MDHWGTGTAIYIVLWWLVIFVVLPFGVRPPNADEMEKGQEPGAPVKPMMWRKVAITTVITAVLWLIIYFIVMSGLISFSVE
jgi:predicted secreted protein